MKKPTATTPTTEQAADLANVINFLAEASAQPQPDRNDDDSFWLSGSPKIKIKDQPALAMTISPAGDLLLRMHAEPKDVVIIVTQHFLPQFLEDLHDTLGIKPPLWSPRKLSEENK